MSSKFALSFRGATCSSVAYVTISLSRVLVLAYLPIWFVATLPRARVEGGIGLEKKFRARFALYGDKFALHKSSLSLHRANLAPKYFERREEVSALVIDFDWSDDLRWKPDASKLLFRIAPNTISFKWYSLSLQSKHFTRLNETAEVTIYICSKFEFLPPCGGRR